MNIKENGRLEFTTDEERNAFLNALLNLKLVYRNGMHTDTINFFNVIFNSRFITDSIIEAILDSEDDNYTISLARNSFISSETVDRLIKKNNNDINIELLYTIKDGRLFNEVLGKLLDDNYMGKISYYKQAKYLNNELINIDNFKRLYDVACGNRNLGDYSDFVYRNLFKDLEKEFESDRLECIYSVTMRKVLDADPKFLTRPSFKQSKVKDNDIYDIFKCIMNNSNCPEYILKELSKCKYSTPSKTTTLGSIARNILANRNK